jgi:mRNA interferase MazF
MPVVSNAEFHRRLRAALICPIINTDSSIPIQILLDSRTNITGLVMCDQVKSFNIHNRNPPLIEQAPGDLVAEAVGIINGLLEIL